MEIIRGKLPSWINGSGYGYGYGDGYGYGYGSGSGSGSGDGDGYGYGYGDGYGSGYGDEYGYGSGYGDEYGYGSGYGDEYGDEYGYYWSSTIEEFAGKWSPEQRQRLSDLSAAGAKIAFWRSDENGLPSNGGGRIEPAAAGVIHTSVGPLSLCSNGTLHATLLPTKWKGERWWIVALIGNVIGDDEKYGALEREIIGEAL